MALVSRLKENPLLAPDPNNSWEAEAVFNGCPVWNKNKIYFLYRAMSESQEKDGANLNLSSIGWAESKDGINFKKRRQIIKPDQEWDKFGCEDPRVTKLNGKYYIFYTALSTYPFGPEGIKVGVAITKNFKKIEKHPVTTFNSKAMVLFPEKINGKYVAVLSTHTDTPPVKNCIAFFDKEEDIWSEKYWEKWHQSIHDHLLPLKQGSQHLAEIGTPPIKTKYGWILFYANIQNYHSPKPTIYGIEAVLLDLKNPSKIIGRTNDPLLIPKHYYETEGNVPNVIFPSGAIEKDNYIYLYYGAADTKVCTARIPLEEFAEELKRSGERLVWFNRYEKNPIITPNLDHDWENKATFNPTALYLNQKIHIIYRAMSKDNTSVFGYATSKDGFKIEKRFPKPIYTPRMEFEKTQKLKGFSGCEDPRAAQIGNDIYVTYTAFNGKIPRIALSSIEVEDFLNQKWDKWRQPYLISPPGVENKDCAIFPEKINGKYVFLHRPDNKDIWIDFVSDLTFSREKWLGGHVLFEPRGGSWDSEKIGAACSPIKTEQGWLLFYHGLSSTSRYYRVGAVLLELKSPRQILARTHEPLFEPRMPYEKEGQVDNVVFPGGVVLIGTKLFMYYGGADSVVGVATVELGKLMRSFFIK